jgi:hypothetical protein
LPELEHISNAFIGIPGLAGALPASVLLTGRESVGHAMIKL